MKYLLFTCIMSMLLMTAIGQQKHTSPSVELPKDTIGTQQDTVNAIRIMISAGKSMPYGNFGAHTVQNPSPYFAKTGSTIAIGVALDFHKHIAIGLSMGIRANAVDTETYIETYKPYMEIEKFTSGTWYSGFLLTDLYVQIPVKRIVFYSKLSCGLSYSTHPDHYIKYGHVPNSDFSYRAHTLKADPAIDFAYGYAGGARYELGRWGLGLEAGFLALFPKFLLEGNSDGGRWTTDFERDMNTFSTSFSLSYYLLK